MQRFLYGKLLIAIGLLVLLSTSAAPAREWSEEYEKKVGERAAAQIAEEYEFYDDEETRERVANIANSLASYTQRPGLQYTVVLLDDSEANAFTIPGSYIYVTKGLLDAVESEAQLAGIIAHEMAHNCTYDGLDQLKRARQMSLATAVALIVAIATGRSEEAAYGVLTAGQIVTRGVLSRYSIEIESRADRNAVSYLLASDYDPVGLLTFMEELARKERQRPRSDLGIFTTHPFSTKRVADIIDLLEEADMEINRRAVTKWDPPVVEAGEIEGASAQILKLWDEQLFAFASSPDDGDLAARGQQMVDVLTELLRAGVRAYEFGISSDDEGRTTVTARGQRLLTVYPEDADLVGKSIGDTASEVTRALRRALYRERLDRLY